MLVKVSSVAHIGLESVGVTVEVDVAEAGFPGFTIVGLATKAVEEARERVKTAIINSGFDFPPKKITVNLAPADLPKEGGAYDLPIAVGVLVASGQLPAESAHGALFYGELGLDGSLRATKGVLLVALYAKRNIKLQEPHATEDSTSPEVSVFVPIESANEAAVVSGLCVYPLRNLRELADHAHKLKAIERLKPLPLEQLIEDAVVDFDLAEVVGQEQAKRALTIAAAGGHNLLLWGPPGTGKTMLARAMPGILPALSPAEALEVTKIYSAAGLLMAGESLVRRRPYRSPHHGVSAAGMIGGGSNPSPGEVSLAHHGVLFLDEMAEFSRSVLEALRQPLEDGSVAIVRASAHVMYPAQFSLLAAVNPCPCGYLGHPTRECTCSPKQIAAYRHRLSGPILDRIDLHVRVGVVDVEKLQQNSKFQGPSSKEIQHEVVMSRKIQLARYVKDGIFTNAQMKNKHVKKYAELDGAGLQLMRVATQKFDLSARSYFRIIKVARTIADLVGADAILPEHVAEALQYRNTV